MPSERSKRSNMVVSQVAVVIPAKSARIFCDVLIRVAVWITLTSNLFQLG